MAEPYSGLMLSPGNTPVSWLSSLFQDLGCDYLGKSVKCEELTCLQYADVMHF